MLLSQVPCLQSPISSELQQVACKDVQYLDQKQLLITKASPQLRLTPFAYHKHPVQRKK